MTGPEWTFFYFGWNTAKPWFKDKRVRRAMAYAFDHKEMLEKLNYGLTQPGNGPFNPTSKMYPKKKLPFFEQDLDKAEELLQAAGWEDSDEDGVLDKNGVKFEFTIICGDVPERVRMCALLKENLEQIGIKCNVRPMEIATLFGKLEARDYDAVFAGFGTAPTQIPATTFIQPARSSRAETMADIPILMLMAYLSLANRWRATRKNASGL